MAIRIKDTSHYLDTGRWKWSVWLEGTSRELDKIKFVRYTLHPTFRNPVRIVRNRSRGFRLDSSGWGSFTIGVETVFRDGTSHKRSHDLVLEPPKRRRPLARRPVIFLSYSAADSQAADALRRALEANRARLADAETSAGLPWKSSIDRSIQSADAAIGMISDSTSPWVERELAMAMAHDLPVLRVITGEMNLAREPEPGLETIRLSSAEDATRVAKAVMTWLSKHAAVGKRAKQPKKSIDIVEKRGM